MIYNNLKFLENMKNKINNDIEFYKKIKELYDKRIIDKKSISIFVQIHDLEYLYEFIDYCDIENKKYIYNKKTEQAKKLLEDLDSEKNKTKTNTSKFNWTVISDPCSISTRTTFKGC